MTREQKKSGAKPSAKMKNWVPLSVCRNSFVNSPNGEIKAKALPMVMAKKAIFNWYQSRDKNPNIQAYLKKSAFEKKLPPSDEKFLLVFQTNRIPDAFFRKSHLSITNPHFSKVRKPAPAYLDVDAR